MKLKLSFLSVLILLSVIIYAQSIKKNNIYLELGGAALYYSLNYERMILKNEGSRLAPRIGITYVPDLINGGRKIIGAPIGFSYLSKLRKNFFETGLTYSLLLDRRETLVGSRPKSFDDSLSEIFSYRLGIRRGGDDWFMNFLFQLSFMKAESKADEMAFAFPFLSLGFGKSF